jgi:hypothetical protein
MLRTKQPTRRAHCNLSSNPNTIIDNCPSRNTLAFFLVLVRGLAPWGAGAEEERMEAIARELKSMQVDL